MGEEAPPLRSSDPLYIVCQFAEKKAESLGSEGRCRDFVAFKGKARFAIGLVNNGEVKTYGVIWVPC